MGMASKVQNQEQSLRPVLMGLIMAAAVLGGVASWFASTHPDGLEWSIAKVTGRENLAGGEDGVHEKLAATPESWPAVKAGTSVSGIVGGTLTLGLASLIGFALKARMKVA